MTYDYPTKELVEMVDKRDLKCIYCQCEFDNTLIDGIVGKNPRYPTYDHLDCSKPFSTYNIVKCCFHCNASKNDTPVLKWLAKKKYQVNPIILELLNK